MPILFLFLEADLVLSGAVLLPCCHFTQFSKKHVVLDGLGLPASGTSFTPPESSEKLDDFVCIRGHIDTAINIETVVFSCKQKL